VRRDLFVSAKGPKTIFARAQPLLGSLCPRPESRWLGNSLRSNSPRREVDSVRQLSRARRREEFLSLPVTPAFVILSAMKDLPFRYETAESYTGPYKIPEKDGQRMIRPQRLARTMVYAVYCLTILKGLYCRTTHVGSYTEPDNL